MTTLTQVNPRVIEGTEVERANFPAAKMPAGTFFFSRDLGPNGTLYLLDINGSSRSWKLIAGGTATGNLVQVTQPFTFSDGVLPLQSVLAGDQISRVCVIIQTPFNDPLASITVGTTGNPSLLMSAGDNFPAFSNQYNTSEVTIFSLPDTMQLTINAGTSTQGSGILLYHFRAA